MTVVSQKLRQRFAVREVEAAAPGHQKFAAGGKHGIVDGDLGAAVRQHLSRHQPGGAGSDDSDVALGRGRRQRRHSRMRHLAQARNSYSPQGL